MPPMKLIHVVLCKRKQVNHMYFLSLLLTQWHQRRNINQNVHITVWPDAKGRGFQIAQAGKGGKGWGGGWWRVYLYLLVVITSWSSQSCPCKFKKNNFEKKNKNFEKLFKKMFGFWKNYLNFIKPMLPPEHTWVPSKNIYIEDNHCN